MDLVLVPVLGYLRLIFVISFSVRAGHIFTNKTLSWFDDNDSG